MRSQDQPDEVFAPFSLQGRVALVTGASSGFGRHFGSVLARAGAKVALAARRTEKVEAACESIRANGGEALAVTLDVVDTDSIVKAFNQVEKMFDVVTVVVNNAGITVPKPLVELSDEDWSRVIDTNLNGVAYVTREASRRMIAARTGGSVVNIASILAYREQKLLTNYAASKAGVVQFTRTAALELAQHDIRVNAICPGYFETDLNREWLASNEGQAMIRRIPQRRVGDLDDLNGPLLLLASDAGALMTGAALTVDGGHVLSSL
jgi:NAD(P)-dependent dehydrogenase (short-subunit alcohol dehydrogenase family)